MEPILLVRCCGYGLRRGKVGSLGATQQFGVPSCRVVVLRRLENLPTTSNFFEECDDDVFGGVSFADVTPALETRRGRVDGGGTAILL